MGGPSWILSDSTGSREMHKVLSHWEGVKNMNKKIILSTLAVIGILGSGAFFAQSAMAQEAWGQARSQNLTAEEKDERQLTRHARGDRRLEEISEKLGMSADELSSQLESKTMHEIVEESGIDTAQFEAERSEARRAHWAERGFSDEEISEREQKMAEKSGDCDGSGMNLKVGGRGMGNK